MVSVTRRYVMCVSRWLQSVSLHTAAQRSRQVTGIPAAACVSRSRSCICMSSGPVLCSFFKNLQDKQEVNIPHYSDKLQLYHWTAVHVICSSSAPFSARHRRRLDELC